ncbi:MAG: HAD family phosphatase [Polyangiaceae bacterium]
MADQRALIFDMDGLMVDSEPMWWRVEKAFAERRGGVWTDELAMSCVGKGLPHLMAVMRDALGLSLTIDAGVTELVDDFIRRVDELALKPGCREIVDGAVARGRRRAVASSSPHRLIRAVLDRFSLTDRFEVVVSGEDVVQGKPAPDIFLLTAERLGVTAADCVVFEDSVAGVTAGRAAGMTVIAVPEHDDPVFAELTPHVVADLHAARALVGL